MVLWLAHREPHHTHCSPQYVYNGGRHKKDSLEPVLFNKYINCFRSVIFDFLKFLNINVFDKL